jgi:hypothetical protein
MNVFLMAWICVRTDNATYLIGYESNDLSNGNGNTNRKWGIEVS